MAKALAASIKTVSHRSLNFRLGRKLTRQPTVYSCGLGRSHVSTVHDPVLLTRTPDHRWCTQFGFCRLLSKSDLVGAPFQ